MRFSATPSPRGEGTPVRTLRWKRNGEMYCESKQYDGWTVVDIYEKYLCCIPFGRYRRSCDSLRAG